MLLCPLSTAMSPKHSINWSYSLFIYLLSKECGTYPPAFSSSVLSEGSSAATPSPLDGDWVNCSTRSTSNASWLTDCCRSGSTWRSRALKSSRFQGVVLLLVEVWPQLGHRWTVLVWSNALLRMQSRVVLKLSVAVTSASPSTILSRVAHPSFLMFTYPRGIQHRRFLLRTAQAQDVPTLLGCQLGSVSIQTSEQTGTWQEQKT